jgi:ChaC-like protein
MTDQQKLTRELIEAGAIEAMVARDAPAMQLLSEQARAVSLHTTLAGPSGDAWLFGYGSLIWNPMIHTVERRTARIEGWHRAFCVSTLAGRGSIDNPGLVLGFVPPADRRRQDSGPMSRRGKRGRVRPPSRTMERPVMKSNSGSQSRATTFAISVSVTSRPSGVPAIAARL